ncbi:MAG TPA: DAHL domain-containing protein [Polyangiaceae bacterium]|nr:DAHL domain-containing protein [Polyangiaceae bacterium]
MRASRLLRVVLALLVVAFAALALYAFEHEIDDAEHGRYAYALKRIQTLDTGLDRAVLKSRSGLLPQYDPLVNALAELRRLRASLARVPRYLASGDHRELLSRLDEWAAALAHKDELIETFKTENSVVQTSLHYFPLVATSVIDRARGRRPGNELAARMQALSTAVMLFETAPEPEAAARVVSALDDLRTSNAATALGLDRDVGVAAAHARVILERKPGVDAAVQAILAEPTAHRAQRAEESYAGLHFAAADASLARKQWLFAFALAVVVLGLTEVILGVRRTALALEKVTQELTLANAALAVEHEKERQLGELRNRFVAMTSHEFRTPLTAIVSSAELLQSFGAHWESERRVDHLERIRLAAGTMQRMLEDVLVIGRAEAGGLRASPSPIRLDEFCKRLVETLEHSSKKSHDIRYTFLGDPDVTMDERLLQHVLGNLLSNALKYSPAGSEVRFDVRTSGDECQFSVKDAGIGIPHADLPKLFMSFSRASNTENVPGTGLGLAVVKKALDVQQGTIRVESELGRGTLFQVTIPRRLGNIDTTLTP